MSAQFCGSGGIQGINTKLTDISSGGALIPIDEKQFLVIGKNPEKPRIDLYSALDLSIKKSIINEDGTFVESIRVNTDNSVFQLPRGEITSYGYNSIDKILLLVWKLSDEQRAALISISFTEESAQVNQILDQLNLSEGGFLAFGDEDVYHFDDGLYNSTPYPQGKNGSNASSIGLERSVRLRKGSSSDLGYLTNISGLNSKQNISSDPFFAIISSDLDKLNNTNKVIYTVGLSKGDNQTPEISYLHTMVVELSDIIKDLKSLKDWNIDSSRLGDDAYVYTWDATSKKLSFFSYAKEFSFLNHIVSQKYANADSKKRIFSTSSEEDTIKILAFPEVLKEPNTLDFFSLRKGSNSDRATVYKEFSLNVSKVFCDGDSIIDMVLLPDGNTAIGLIDSDQGKYLTAINTKLMTSQRAIQKSFSTIRNIQSTLYDNKHYNNVIDGEWNKETIASVKKQLFDGIDVDLLEGLLEKHRSFTEIFNNSLTDEEQVIPSDEILVDIANLFIRKPEEKIDISEKFSNFEKKYIDNFRKFSLTGDFSAVNFIDSSLKLGDEVNVKKMPEKKYWCNAFEMSNILQRLQYDANAPIKIINSFANSLAESEYKNQINELRAVTIGVDPQIADRVLKLINRQIEWRFFYGSVVESGSDEENRFAYFTIIMDDPDNLWSILGKTTDSPYKNLLRSVYYKELENVEAEYQDKASLPSGNDRIVLEYDTETPKYVSRITPKVDINVRVLPPKGQRKSMLANKLTFQKPPLKASSSDEAGSTQPNSNENTGYNSFSVRDIVKRNRSLWFTGDLYFHVDSEDELGVKIEDWNLELGKYENEESAQNAISNFKRMKDLYDYDMKGYESLIIKDEDDFRLIIKPVKESSDSNRTKSLIKISRQLDCTVDFPEKRLIPENLKYVLDKK